MFDVGWLPSFRPERAISPNLGVNLRFYLCGVHEYASAQNLDFLDLGKTDSFLNRKLKTIRILFQYRHYLNGLFGEMGFSAEYQFGCLA